MNDENKQLVVYSEQKEKPIPSADKLALQALIAEFQDKPRNSPHFKIDEKTKQDIWNWLGITELEFQQLIKFRANQEVRHKYVVFMMGVLFMPVTLAGALIGYARGYNRFFKYKNTPSVSYSPNFYPLYPIIKVAMAIGIAVAWVVLLVSILVLLIFGETMSKNQAYFIFGYLAINTLLSFVVFGVFQRWRSGIKSALYESQKFGSARWASLSELQHFKTGKGFYLGQDLFFEDKGHILTVAGTRGGKGTNIIIPNLLGAADSQTSWVVIDPKGENAAITANWQRANGQNVVILNPWDLLKENIGEAQSYNPLDILSDISDPNLVDDVQMIAEMIVPIKMDDRNAFFSDSARSIISGLLLHLVTTETKEERTLAKLWHWTRLAGDEWDNLLADMGLNETPVNGVIVQNARREIMKFMEAGNDTFGSIISNVLQATDFLKSPPLQKSLESGFDPKVLAEGKTTVYVIIPADKLTSHGRWLRLVVTSMMRAVIRKPKNRVTFLLDEFAALGYLPEIETALSTYAGYNVTVWPILQSLIQLQALYGQNWQSFIANCAVRQYFTVNDNQSAFYVSEAIGHTSNVSVSRSWFGIGSASSSARLLITPDELRRESGKRIFMFINDLPPTYINKMPYYLVPEFIERADKNPYI